MESVEKWGESWETCMAFARISARSGWQRGNQRTKPGSASRTGTAWQRNKDDKRGFFLARSRERAPRKGGVGEGKRKVRR
ncbi:hypothetical protein AGMMS49960_09370 [Betaproteobacteria bacterium]|nr:hypothetical protein AGMMS49960_09370 [Betaproteobacteria bacterium]GHU17638.1 hypothetical protein AGMMS50243_06200 [Betaproteobacteria bacterium]